MVRYRIFTFATLFIICATQLIGQNYKTEAISDEIHSIQVLKNGDWNSYPIITLNSSDQIHFSFDKVSDELLSRLRYKLIYCNADWTENSNLLEMDFLQGFNDNPIEDYATSFNTTVSYTNYAVRIPNEEVSLKLSGNYAIVVYDEDMGEDEVLLTACFSVLDKQVTLAPQVSTITDIDANDKHHQLSFDLKYNFPIRDVKNDLKVFVRQNNRLDNERRNVQPTYTMPSQLKYAHNKDLIFEAGNEYHRFDVSSHRSNGMNVAHIEYKRPYYHMFLSLDKVHFNGSYSYDQDQNGRVIYRNLDSDNVDTEGDYFYVHFILQADMPFQDDVYLNGAFTNNEFSEKYKMHYDVERKEYQQTLLLKQGIYNYQYLVDKRTHFSTEEIDGNFYETENEYSIYVYYRPPGQRYDSMIGFTSLQSRAK